MNEREIAELSPGERIGDYRVKRLLGRGGFGEVYLAENVHLAENVGSCTEVAVKVFRPSEANVRLATSSREGEGLRVLRDRFLHEAQTLQDMGMDAAVVDVRHVSVLDTGDPYYVMPYSLRRPRQLRKLRQRTAYSFGDTPEHGASARCSRKTAMHLPY